MPASKQFSDQRNFKRLSMNCPVSYQIIDKPEKKTGTCINLSASGVLLECEDNYPIGTKINISVSPKPSISPYFSAVMEVVRVELLPEKAGFQLGGMLVSEEHLNSLNASWVAQ